MVEKFLAEKLEIVIEQFIKYTKLNNSGTGQFHLLQNLLFELGSLKTG